MVIPGCLHHVTQRGNHRQLVFLNEDDRWVYLDLLRSYLARYSTSLAGYSLMGNHTHLAPIPESTDSLARTIGHTHQDYSRWFQLRRNQTGHLWQNRYFSCPVEDERFHQVLAYIELNPVRAGLVHHAWDWTWSSARAHVTGHDPTGLLDMEYWQRRVGKDDWKQFLLRASEDDRANRGIRQATSTGRPWGNESFLLEAERRLGRTLRPRPRGRKPIVQAWPKSGTS